MTPAPEQPSRLGQGRSGVVYKVPRERADDGAARRDADYLAVKVFTGEPLAKLVLYVLTGAPNPYIWNEHAIRCCAARRRILATLVEHWFGDALRVADAAWWKWNDEHDAYELAAEYSPGRQASLHHPFSADRDDELRELLDSVMRPLQQHLIDSGFDGLVWQAGKGNPVATNNFLLSHTDDGERRWTWIDLESGVPALFPLNPLQLLGFYVPKSIRHGRALFDDVDIPVLKRWIAANREHLDRTVGAARVGTLLDHVEELEHEQNRWRIQRRAHRSIEYAEKKSRISKDQADWYRRHVAAWYGRMALRLPGRAVSGVWSAIKRAGRLIARINVPKLVTALWMTLISQRYRIAVAHRYVSYRISTWKDRRQLTPDEAAYLREHLDDEEASEYLADFGVHLAIKPAVKICQWFVAPALFAAGMIGPLTLAIILATGGVMGRTLYTTGRLIQATLRGRERPWVALGAGLLPVLGNAAYPLQVIYTGAGHRARLAQFIVYDTFTHIGGLVPIWGGADTHTEHFFNRFGDLVVRHRSAVDTDADDDGLAEATPAPAVSTLDNA